jgi:hypothetical protein
MLIRLFGVVIGRTALKKSDQGSGNQPSARNWTFDTIPASGQGDGLFGVDVGS